MILCFDIETTPIPDDPRELPDTVWCIVTQDVETGEKGIFGPHELQAGVAHLERADLLVGHNIAGFDIPILEGKVRPFRWTRLFDTLRASQLVYASNRYERMIAFRNSAGRDEDARERKLPRRMLKSHSLESWGYLLGHKKLHVDVDLDFYRQYSEELLERCVRDVELNVGVYRSLLGSPADRGWDVCAPAAIEVESRFAYLLGIQERNGVGFDRARAEALVETLAVRRAELVTELQRAFPAWYAPTSGQKDHDPAMPRRDGDAGYVITKRDRTMKPTEDRPWPVAYVAGAAHTKVELVEYNPASTHHRAHTLKAKYGWKPAAFTETGDPEVSEDVLAGLDYPEIPPLIEYMTVEKRLGQIAEGQQAWFKHDRGGRIHGRVMPTGTRTSRCSHSKPNLGQVPKNKSPFGKECRACFRPTREGWVQVGADASGLELRMLAHRLAYYDAGAFGVVLLSGDPHEEWRRATGMFLRENQKTFTYAMLYGAGDEKLGLIILIDWREAFAKGLTSDKPPRLAAAMELGKEARLRLFRNVPALGALVRGIRAKKAQGWFRALDGRILAIKSEHSALNDLLQSDGAIFMKHAKIRFDELLHEAELALGRDYAWMLDVHDEWQLEARPEVAKTVGELATRAIVETGVAMKIRIAMAGEFKVGSNWSETH